MKVVVHIALSVHEKLLSIDGDHVLIWKGVYVETFEELSIHILAWRCVPIYIFNSS